MSNSSETVLDLVGAVDGVNRTFTVPTRFLLGSFRAVVNGIFYPSDDERWGYSELNPTTIRFAVAPKAGCRIQGFYSEPQAEGSPFSGGSIP